MPAKIVTRNIMSFFIRSIYLAFAAMYMLFATWAGFDLSGEMFPVYFLISSLVFAGLSPRELAETKNGIVVIFIIAGAGIIGCLTDAYRLHKEPDYAFDGVSILILLATLILLIVFMFRSLDIFHGKGKILK